MNRRKNNKNTVIKFQQPKKDNVINKINNRNLIIGFSNCGKTYLMVHIVLQNQEPLFMITKSLNQYINTKAQTSDENEPLENYENSIVVIDDMLLSKQGTNIDLFLTRARHSNIDLYNITQISFLLPNILLVKILLQLFYLNKL